MYFFKFSSSCFPVLRLALRLGQPSTKLAEHLATGEGQAALLNFLSARVAPALKDGPGRGHQRPQTLNRLITGCNFVKVTGKVKPTARYLSGDTESRDICNYVLVSSIL